MGLRHNAPALPPPQRPPSAAPSERRSRAAAASAHRWAPMGLTASLADEPSGNSDVFCDHDHQLAHQQHQPQHIGLVSHTSHPPSNGLVLAGGPHGLEQDQGPELLLSLDGWGPGGGVGGFRRAGGYGAPRGVDASASSEDGAQVRGAVAGRTIMHRALSTSKQSVSAVVCMAHQQDVQELSMRLRSDEVAKCSCCLWARGGCYTCTQ